MPLTDQIVSYVNRRFVRASGEPIGPDESLLDSGLVDSIGIVEIVGFLESEFGISVPDEEIVPDNFETITQIADFVRRQRGDALAES